MSGTSKKQIAKAGKGKGSEVETCKGVSAGSVGDESEVFISRESICGVCNCLVRDKDVGIQCMMCDKWYHLGCQDIPAELYSLLGVEGLHWFCKLCNCTFLKTMKNVSKLEEKNVVIEKSLSDNKQALVSLQEQVTLTGIKWEGEIRKLENSVRCEIDKLYAKNLELEEKIVQRQVNEQVLNEPESMTGYNRTNIIEEIEIDRRKHNLILFGATEQENEGDVVDKVLTALVGESKNVVVTRVERVGKIRGDKGRPIKFTLGSMGIRSEILKNAASLKGTELGNYYIVPDLTPRQQIEDRNLRQKLKEIRENEGNEAIIKIKRGKIIKNVGGREVIMFPPSMRNQN